MIFSTTFGQGQPLKTISILFFERENERKNEIFKNIVILAIYFIIKGNILQL